MRGCTLQSTAYPTMPLIAEVEPPLLTLSIEAVRSVTLHYSQDVHLNGRSTSSGGEGNNNEEESERPPRHFQRIRRVGGTASTESSVSSSRVVKHWSEKLLSAAAADTSTSTTTAAAAATSAAAEVLGLYPRIVRETIVRQFPATLPGNYEDEDELDVRPNQRVDVGRYSHLTSRYFYELIGDLRRKIHEVDDTDSADTDNAEALGRTVLALDDDDDASEPKTTTRSNHNDPIGSICQAIVALAEDVISLTAAPSILTRDEEQISAAMTIEADRIRNITMPYLFDLICVGLELIQELDRMAFGDVRTRTVEGNVKDAVVAALIAAACFTSGTDGSICDKVDADTIHPALSPKFSVSYALWHTLADPKAAVSEFLPGVESTTEGYFCDDLRAGTSLPVFDRPVVDLSSRFVSSPWSRSRRSKQDGKSIVEVSADHVLSTIVSALCDKQEHDQSTSRSMLVAIVRSLGRQSVVDSVRSHFFGRGLVSSTNGNRSVSTPSGTTAMNRSSSRNDSFLENRSTIDSITDSIVARNIASNILPWPRNSRPKVNTASGRSKATLLPESRAHAAIPSRLCSSIRLCAAVATSSGIQETDEASRSTLANLLPIIYCLVDSINATEQTLGGSTLLLLLDQYEAEHWTTFASAAEDVLSLSIKTGCSDPVALAVLSRARFELELVQQNFLELSGEEQKAGRMRKIVNSLFEVVHKSSYSSCIRGEEEYSERSTQEAFVTSALLGGIHPLLSHLADLPDEIAASAELVRSGLATLLPFIGWDVPSKRIESSRLQLSALACLEELMVGGHPIVRRHGGKIMSELLGCIYRAQKSTDHVEDGLLDRKGDAGVNTNEQIVAAKAVASLGIRVACFALVLCGERAKALLETVEGGEGENEYDPGLVSVAKDVQNIKEGLVPLP